MYVKLVEVPKGIQIVSESLRRAIACKLGSQVQSIQVKKIDQKRIGSNKIIKQKEEKSIQLKRGKNIKKKESPTKGKTIVQKSSIKRKSRI
jgi:hypothetical protein